MAERWLLEAWRNEEPLLKQECLSCLVDSEEGVRAEGRGLQEWMDCERPQGQWRVILQWRAQTTPLSPRPHASENSLGITLGRARDNSRREDHTAGLIIGREMMITPLSHRPVTESRGNHSPHQWTHGARKY